MKRRGARAGIQRSWARLLTFALDIVVIEGDSMAPTFTRGDWLLVRYLRPSTAPRVKVGEVVLVERTDQPGPLLIKRLKDIRGDSPNRHYPTYWVEGDNGELSQDSRTWGALEGAEIVGKVLFRVKRAAR